MSPEESAVPEPPGALLIDLGNVLFPFDHGRACGALGQLAGLEPAEVRRRVFDEGLERDFDLGRHTPDEFATLVAGALVKPWLPAQALLGAWCDIFTRHEENLALLAPLARRFRLVLVSNTNAAHYRWLEARAPEFTAFHARVLSFEEGLRKPEAGFYHLALERAGRAAGQCLLVDDSPSNLDGASALGIRTALHPPGASLQETLAGAGVGA